jgi:3D (Asp-Asp-Asp) domain-containing protein
MTQAFNLSQLANNVNASGQLLGSAVTGAVANATNATTANYATSAGSTSTATNATNAANLITNDFRVFQSGTKLYFSFQGTTIASLDQSGNFTTIGNVGAAGAP